MNRKKYKQPKPVLIGNGIQANMIKPLNISNAHQQNICRTCGTRYSNIENGCLICKDDRQYVANEGEHWVSFNELKENHSIKLKKHTDQLYELKILPDLAISQRAFFIKTDSGNILWDCIPLITQPIIDFIQRNGGIQAIVISHPHYYSLMNEWAKVFQSPIFIHQLDSVWVMDALDHIHFWTGKEYQLSQNLTIIHTGGHFPGSSVLQAELQDLGETLFIGDSLYLSKDKKHLSVMYSYPNLIPLNNSGTLKVFEIIGKYKFDAIFGAFDHQSIYSGAREIFEKSWKRYACAFRN